MHELGLCEDIVAAVEQRAGERPVAKVTIRVGRLHHVHPEAFDQSFAMAAAGGVADGAAAQLVLLPVQVRCHGCDTHHEANELIAVCPRCGGVDLELTGGDELVLESIEYRPADSVNGSHPATSP
ncbi:MAG: hydrogenase nickel incorporation protein HypA/HybF [Acidimicrobiaceae bacterium]|jgi:hydrogenase nickel incorporation protein HypA/HybF|nr:hydrogenase nickel incorporation protein HypA/HybF [Acidimicrobiaceae bacterium]